MRSINEPVADFVKLVLKVIKFANVGDNFRSTPNPFLRDREPSASFHPGVIGKCRLAETANV